MITTKNHLPPHRLLLPYSTTPNSSEWKVRWEATTVRPTAPSSGASTRRSSSPDGPVAVHRRLPPRLFLVAAAAAAAEFLASFIRILSPRPTAGSGQRFLAGIAGAAVHALRMGLLYLVMLAVMSFNVGVLIAAVAGHALGFLVQGIGLGGRWLSDGLANGGDLGYGKL
ncbi:Copper transporter 6 [Platanthera guangdongensis]|uniref:Copper transport protein n=1 Tax=Platanthera guangdongensis TaxID=2320717 RepID=A0ABR2M1T2_9ASPA